MYAPIRQGKAKTGVAEELARRIKEGVAYAPDDPVTAITKQPPMSSTDHAGRKRRPGTLLDQDARSTLTMLQAQPDGHARQFDHRWVAAAT